MLTPKGDRESENFLDFYVLLAKFSSLRTLRLDAAYLRHFCGLLKRQATSNLSLRDLDFVLRDFV